MRTSTSFQKGHTINEGRIRTPEVVANVRAAALLRESTIRRRVYVKGEIYANNSQAAEATKMSPRSVARYAASDLYEHRDVFYV